MLRKTYLQEEIYNHFLKKFKSKSLEDIDIEIEEFLKYILLSCYKKSKAFIPVNKEIDLIWHEFILQTREYKAFCDNLPNNRGFIHHKSLPYDEYKENIIDEEIYREHSWWLGAYKQNFNQIDTTVIKYWAIPKYLYEYHDWTIEELNEYADFIIDKYNIQKYKFIK